MSSQEMQFHCRKLNSSSLVVNSNGRFKEAKKVISHKKINSVLSKLSLENRDTNNSKSNNIYNNYSQTNANEKELYNSICKTNRSEFADSCLVCTSYRMKNKYKSSSKINKSNNISITKLALNTVIRNNSKNNFHKKIGSQTARPNFKSSKQVIPKYELINRINDKFKYLDDSIFNNLVDSNHNFNNDYYENYFKKSKNRNKILLFGGKINSRNITDLTNYKTTILDYKDRKHQSNKNNSCFNTINQKHLSFNSFSTLKANNKPFKKNSNDELGHKFLLTATDYDRRKKTSGKIMDCLKEEERKQKKKEETKLFYDEVKNFVLQSRFLRKSKFIENDINIHNNINSNINKIVNSPISTNNNFNSDNIDNNNNNNDNNKDNDNDNNFNNDNDNDNEKKNEISILSPDTISNKSIEHNNSRNSNTSNILQTSPEIRRAISIFKTKSFIKTPVVHNINNTKYLDSNQFKSINLDDCNDKKTQKRMSAFIEPKKFKFYKDSNNLDFFSELQNMKNNKLLLANISQSKKREILDINSNKRKSILNSIYLQDNNDTQTNNNNMQRHKGIKRSSLMDNFIFKLANTDDVMEDYEEGNLFKCDKYKKFKKLLFKKDKEMQKLINSMKRQQVLTDQLVHFYANVQFHTKYTLKKHYYKYK